jgi:hypothetical protein
MPISQVYFVVNGMQSNPYVKQGVAVVSDMYILNSDTQPHDFYVVVYDDASGAMLWNQDLGTIPGTQYGNISPLPSFTMPNADDYIDYWIYVDGELDTQGQWPVMLEVVVNPPVDQTNIYNGALPTQAKPGTTVNFTAVIKNVSSQNIVVQLTAAFNYYNTVESVDAELANPNITLAPGETQTITGSFVMPSYQGWLFILAAVQNSSGTYVSDYIYQSDQIDVQTTGPATLVIQSPSVAQNGVLSFSFTGFEPSTAVTVTVVGTQNSFPVSSDTSGAGSGQITITVAPGSHSLVATDLYGNTSPAVPFTVTQPVIPTPTTGWDILKTASIKLTPGEFTIPVGYSQVLSTIFPDGKTYSGQAQRVYATFNFLPANFPGAEWFINLAFDQKVADQIKSKGEKPLDMTLYENGFNYIVVFEASNTSASLIGNAAPLFGIDDATLIIAGVITLLALIVIGLTVNEVVQFLYKAPGTAITIGAIVAGVAVVTVVGIAIWKGSSSSTKTPTATRR